MEGASRKACTVHATRPKQYLVVKVILPTTVFGENVTYLVKILF